MGGGGYKSLGGMDPDTFAPSDVIHLVVMEIDLDLSVVLQLLMMMRWGNFQMRSSLTCLRGMMMRNRLSLLDTAGISCSMLVC